RTHLGWTSGLRRGKSAMLTMLVQQVSVGGRRTARWAEARVTADGQAGSDVCGFLLALLLLIEPILQLPDQALRAFAGQRGYAEHGPLPVEFIAQASGDFFRVGDHVELVEYEPAGLGIEVGVV